MLQNIPRESEEVGGGSAGRRGRRGDSSERAGGKEKQSDGEVGKEGGDGWMTGKEGVSKREGESGVGC